MYTGPSWAGTQASLIRLNFLAYTWIHISVSKSILICLLKVGGVPWFRLGVPWLVHRLVPVFWHTPSSSVIRQTLAMLMVRENNAPLLPVTGWGVTYFHGQTDIKLILTSLLHSCCSLTTVIQCCSLTTVSFSHFAWLSCHSALPLNTQYYSTIICILIQHSQLDWLFLFLTQVRTINAV